MFFQLEVKLGNLVGSEKRQNFSYCSWKGKTVLNWNEINYSNESLPNGGT